MTLENHHDEQEARLSAYAFGELEGEELAAMEARIAADPLLAVRVAELRAFGEELGAVLKDEPSSADATAAAPVVAAPDQTARSVTATASALPSGRLLHFPAWAWTAAGFAAAAGVAVLVSLRQTELPFGKEELGSQVAPRERAAPAPAPAEPKPLAVSAAVDSDKASVSKAHESFGAAPTVSFEAELAKAKDGFADVSGFKQYPANGPYGGVAPATSASAPVIVDEYSPNASTVGLAAPAAPAAPAASVAPAATPAPSRAWGSVQAASYSRSDSTRRAAPESVAPGLAAGSGIVSRASLVPAAEPAAGSESYAGVRELGFVEVESAPLSTFSIDVDTASYANLRRFIQAGQRPPRDAVRVEELINYFPYRYATPSADSAVPFAAQLSVASAPWRPAHRLVRVGIKGREFAPEARPAANLVFLIDVSGSMSSANKLPLVKASLRQLLGRLRTDDRVAIVTYAGASGLALPSTPVSQREEILASLDRLESGGSTNGGMGIHLAYDIAKANFRPEGVNRVILCTDGDFNVGVTGREELLSLIQEKARARVFLTVLGFGMGNLKDATLEMLADKGNGAYGYIDSEREARKLFVEQVQGTLATIAKDVKIQVEFNPARVASYRLVGYENRALAKEDFNNDQVDAGEVGAGHTVTALYEIVPVGAAVSGDEAGEARPEVDPLKYGPRKKTAPVRRAAPAGETEAAELLTVKIRYKAPDADVSRKLEFPLVDRGARFESADADFRFAAAVAAWGMLLRGSPHAGSATYADVLRWAEGGLADDAGGHRSEFLELVRLTQGGGAVE